MSNCFPGDKEMMGHVDSRCKNLLDDNDYNIVMTQIKMVNKNLCVNCRHVRKWNKIQWNFRIHNSRACARN